MAIAVIVVLAVAVVVAIVAVLGRPDDGSDGEPGTDIPVEGPSDADAEATPDDTTGAADGQDGSTIVPDDAPGDDDDPDAPPATSAPGTTLPDREPPVRPECAGDADGVLTIGTLLPVTGALADLGPAGVAGAQLAVEDINAAGGVLGAEVVLFHGDSGDTTSDLAAAEVDRLLELGADAIMGAVDSAVSFTVIDRIIGACVIQFSPANTSPLFTFYDDDALYFRTAPSDVLQGLVLSDLVLDDGNLSASVIVREDADAEALAGSFRENFEARGGRIDKLVPYSGNLERADDEGEPIVLLDADLDRLVRAGSDAIIVIGLDESAAIVTALHDRGIGPLDTNVYGVGSNIRSIGDRVVDPTILTGLRGTEPGIDPNGLGDFLDRLDAVGDLDGTYTTAAETYDAIIIVALAALVAGTDDPAAIAAEINAVTRPPGTPCASFAACAELIAAGEPIDHIGLGGPYEFAPAGEPSVASFRIVTYDGDATPNPELDEFVIAN